MNKYIAAHQTNFDVIKQISMKENTGKKLAFDPSVVDILEKVINNKNIIVEKKQQRKGIFLSFFDVFKCGN